ncbi:MAG: NAD(P)H-dependent oxidoreductase, partial [Lentisphaerae bacterium]|nr:NAD(P)H-dependent oxidoreductase [Lentisphaerota bacterium]
MTATHSPRRIVVLCGHPLKDSYCASLARAYAEGAREAG